MRFYKMELRRLIANGKFISLFTMLGFIAVVMLIALSVNTYARLSEHSAILKQSYDERHYYKIGPSIEYGQYLENMRPIEMVIRARDTALSLDRSTNFEWHRNTFAPSASFKKDASVMIKDEWLRDYDRGFTAEDYPDGVTLKIISTDKYFWNNPFVKLESGRVFTADEYFIHSLQDNIIPVVLGHEYKEFYEINDIIKDYVLYEGTAGNAYADLQVVGFLEEGSYFYDINHVTVPLNRYMIVPWQDVMFTPSTELEEAFMRGVYMPRFDNSRIVCDANIAENVKAEAERIFVENGLFDYRLFDETSGIESDYRSNNQMTMILFTVTLIITLISTASLIMAVMNKVHREIKSYSIYRLLGVRLRSIYIMSVSETVLTVLLANILSLGLLSYLSISWNSFLLRGEVVAVIFVMQFAVLLTALLITRNKLYKTDLSSMIRGKE